MPFPPVADQLATLRRGTADILPGDGLEQKLERSRKTGTPLLVKLGMDPSRPDLHLGHAVVLRKMRQFQDFGHRAVLIVGDFTATIGDPTGKSKTRPPLTAEETRLNGQTYFEQAGRVLDTDPEKLTVVYNGDWLGPLTFADVIRLAATTTVARMLERDEFRKRYDNGEPISLHEFLYPLAQGQDSVHLQSDIELGGTDQTFNLLVGRSMMEAAGQEPQVCLTMPILEGTDGVQKMSKSLDNYVGLTEEPAESYGKLLSIPDALLYRYAELASDVPTAELPAWKTFAETNPRDAKHDLAYRIVRLYHGEAAADAAREHFEKTVIAKEVPDDLPELTPDWDEEGTGGAASVGLLALIVQAGFASSNSEARRLVKQGAVQIDGEKQTDPLAAIAQSQAPFVLKAGKRKYVQVLAG